VSIFNKNLMSWPDDADGDVLRRLKESNFDFSRIHSIDFNVDLQEWPPEQDLIDLLIERYGDLRGHEPSADMNGYLEFQIKDQLTYELVIKIQNEASQIAKPFDGICQSWGVMQDE
jgi:Regulator of ribonuclease activity B